MSWPNDDILILADVEAGAFSTGITATFDPPEAGRLLMAFYSNDPDADTRVPNQAGWSTFASFGSANSYVYTKVSDGTETVLSITHDTLNRQTTLAVVAIRADPSTLEGISGQARPTAETMVVASAPVNTRFDFTIGEDAPAPYPSTGAPAELIAGHAGAAFRRANSWYAIPLGAQGTGASVPGLTYDDMNVVGTGAWSLLLNVLSPGWFVGFVGHRD